MLLQRPGPAPVNVQFGLPTRHLKTLVTSLRFVPCSPCLITVLSLEKPSVTARLPVGAQGHPDRVWMEPPAPGRTCDPRHSPQGPAQEPGGRLGPAELRYLGDFHAGNSWSRWGWVAVAAEDVSRPVWDRGSHWGWSCPVELPGKHWVWGTGRLWLREAVFQRLQEVNVPGKVMWKCLPDPGDTGQLEWTGGQGRQVHSPGTQCV